MLRNPGLRKSVEQPVLDLNFAASQIGSNGAPDSRIDFSRGSNAWFVDSDGLVKKSPHNLATQSENLANWTTLFNITISSNAGLSPTGELTADKIVADDGATSAGATRSVTGLDDSVDVAVSVYLKAVEASNFKIFFYNKANTFHNSGEFDLTDGSRVSASSSNMQSTIEHVGNDWYRVTMTGMNTATGGTTPNFRIITVSMTNFSEGDGSSGILVWGGQLSQHTTLPVGNPYIKTEGSAVYAARLDHDPTWFMSAAQEQNLLRYSEMLDQSGGGLNWDLQNVNVTANAGTDPLGGSTAELVLENSASGSHICKSPDFDVTKGKIYTASCYVKLHAGTRRFRLAFASGAGDTGFNFRYAQFAITNETCVFNDGDATYEIEDVGNGWFRVSIQSIAANQTASIGQINFQLITSGSTNYQGDGTSGFFIWGAQVEVGSTASTYHRTEGAPYYGEGATPKGLLIEEARTNLSQNSEDIVVNNELTRTENDLLAPDGTTTADKFVITTAASTHAAEGNGNWASNITTGTAHTTSVFVKLLSGTPNLALRGFGLGGFGEFPIFDLDAGTVVRVGTSYTSASIEDYGNGWLRCVATCTPTSQIEPLLHFLESGNESGTLNYTGNGTDAMAFWGLQVEAGSFPTSYIQTTGSTATRNADVAVMGPTVAPDKLGTELVTNGTFDTDTSDWTAVRGATLSVSSGQITNAGDAQFGSGALQGFSTVAGRRYRVTFDVVSVSASGAARVSITNASNDFGAVLADATNLNAGNGQTYDFTAEQATSYIVIRAQNPSTTVVYDNVSVKEILPGTELVTNGTFDTDSDWNDNGEGTIGISGGKLTFASTAQFKNANQFLVPKLVAGRRYRASFDVTSYTSGNLKLQYREGSGNTLIAETTGTSAVVSGKSFDFTCSDAAVNKVQILTTGSGTTNTYEVDNVSVRELYPFEQYNPSEGTVYSLSSCAGDSTHAILSLHDGGFDNHLSHLYRFGNSLRNFSAGGGGATLEMSETVTLSDRNEIAVTYDGTSMDMSVNGSDETTGTLASEIVGLQEIAFGTRVTANQYSGHIERVQYFPRALPKATLQSLTSD